MSIPVQITATLFSLQDSLADVSLEAHYAFPDPLSRDFALRAHPVYAVVEPAKVRTLEKVDPCGLRLELRPYDWDRRTEDVPIDTLERDQVLRRWTWTGERELARAVDVLYQLSQRWEQALEEHQATLGTLRTIAKELLAGIKEVSGKVAQVEQSALASTNHVRRLEQAIQAVNNGRE